MRLKGHCVADCLCVSLSRKGAMVQTKSVDVGHDEEKSGRFPSKWISGMQFLHIE